MSFDYNYKFWVATQKDLDNILKRQEVYKLLKPIEDKGVQHYLFADIYVRYVQLVNKLGYIYHHTFQVQKREILTDLVEAATNRLLELKNELKNIELSEFIYVDKTLIEKRLTPDNIMIWTPKYFPFWRPTNIQEMINGPRKPGHDQRGESFIPFVPASDEKKADESEPKPLDFNTGRRGTKLHRHSHRLSRRQSQFYEDKTNVAKKTEKRMMQKVEVYIDPVKKRLMEAVTLIQCHERARIARVWQTNIRFNPKAYKPRVRDDVIKYVFTHKPNQTMLVPVRRTRFDANYYAKRRSIVDFKYYVKPAWQTTLRFSKYDQEEQEDDLPESDVSEESDFTFQEEACEMEDMWQSDEDEFSNFERESSKTINMEEFFERLFNFSATRIQSYWRGYRDRKKYRVMLQQKSVIYGMSQYFKPKSVLVKAYEERVKEAAKHRLIKERYDQEFIDFCDDERARILRVRAPWIMEDISDNIRAWFKEFYDKLTAFHPYPDEMKGGTLLLLKGETMTVFEMHKKLGAKGASKKDQEKEKQKAKEKKEKEKEKEKKKKKALAKKRAKLKARGIVDFADEMVLSKAIGKIENTISTYKTKWQDIDEKLNRKEEPIKEWITSQYYCEIHQELQVTVDEMMRLEYELLARALAKDLKKKYKPPKKRKPKQKKQKKKKTPVDLTADRSIESLYYEMQDAGIIKAYPKRTYDYFLGDRNLVAYSYLNEEMRDIAPYQEEMKDVIMAYALGMGPLNITKPKSILLVGPTNSGKKLLCDIFATEIDAVVFDISPETTASYQTDVKYLLHIIMKMAKILQPVILFVNNVHRMFWKKVPPEMVQWNPKLLGSKLKKKVLKLIKKENNILLLATTNTPWAANGKMKKLFQKIILIPRSEYASNFMLRGDVTMQYSGVPRDFDVSSMTLVTRDYISGDIVKNISETLNLRRRMRLAARPLQAMEFLDTFLDKEPPEFPMELKAWEKFAKWYKKSYPMARKRGKMMKIRAALYEKMKEKEAKDKKKGKKK